MGALKTMRMDGKISHWAAPDCVHAACKWVKHEAGWTWFLTRYRRAEKARALLSETQDTLQAYVHIFFAVYTIDVDQQFTLAGKRAHKKHQRDIK